jgi:hypothetical protein
VYGAFLDGFPVPGAISTILYLIKSRLSFRVKHKGLKRYRTPMQRILKKKTIKHTEENNFNEKKKQNKTKHKQRKK